MENDRPYSIDVNSVDDQPEEGDGEKAEDDEERGVLFPGPVPFLEKNPAPLEPKL
jgi:hypothetical protein